MTKTDIPGRIVTFRNDRLGGRLISLVNTVRLAKTHDLPFAVRWHEAVDMGRVFNDPKDFFQPDFVDEHFLSPDDWNAIRHQVVRLNNIGKGGVGQLRKLLKQGKNVLIDNAFGLEMLEGENASDVARQTAEVWADFPLSDTLATEAQAIKAKLGEQAMGYHIRRGDIISVRRVMNRPWPNKYVCDEAYFTHIERTIETGATPILFSDDPDTIARFTAQYPALQAAETLYDPSAFPEGQRDALELLTMSHCASIVAPSSSGFSSTAATLGGVDHIDIETDLTPSETHDAGERLLARARIVGDKPPRMRDKGHLSQSLEHLCDYLRRENRLPEAADIIDAHLRGGLNISFLYPKLVEMYLELGEPGKARAVGQDMQRREVHFLFDFATAGMLTGLADLALGDTVSMADRALNAFWNSNTVPMINSACGGLLEKGYLTNENFLPTSPAALDLWRKHPQRLAQTPALCDIIGMGGEDRFLSPVTDAIAWDWMPLMRVIPPNGLTHHRHRAHYEKGFARLERQDNSPDTQSLRAIYDMHVGEDVTWLSRLQRLATEAADDAMVQHRASHASYVAQDYVASLGYAEAAVDVAPEAPGHRMWRGVLRAKANDNEGAYADFKSAADDSFNLPRMHIRLAQVAAKCGDTLGHRHALDTAIRIAPRDSVSRLNRADYFARTNKVDDALADLAIVMRFDQIPPRAQILYDKCMDRKSNAA